MDGVGVRGLVGWWGGQCKNQFEIICTGVMPNFSFLAPTEDEIAICPLGGSTMTPGGSWGWDQWSKSIWNYMYWSHAQFQLPGSNRSWIWTPEGGQQRPPREGWGSWGLGQLKNQFEIICTSLKPNFSFLDQTGAEVANWPPRGVNDDTQGGLGVMGVGSTKKINLKWYLQVSCQISAS